MKEFVAGASGALGAQLVPKLVEADHQVVAMTRTSSTQDRLPGLADATGAKLPRRIPTWLARLAAGEAATVMMTEARGASNAKAKRDLGLHLRYPSWRLGFTEGLG